MANTATKTTRASRKKLTPETAQTHGALEPKEMPNMIHMFGIDDGYQGINSAEQYKQKLNAMVTSDLHDHAYKIGIVPVDQKDKLVDSLVRKYQETKAAQRPVRQMTVPINPKMADWHKQWWSGDVK